MKMVMRLRSRGFCDASPRMKQDGSFHFPFSNEYENILSIVVNVALHGLGRVGRSILRRCALSPDFNIVAVNDLHADVDNIAYCLNYDSLYGTFPEKFGVNDSNLLIRNRQIRILNESDVSVPRWNQLGADVLIDASGETGNISKLKSLVESRVVARTFTTHLAPEADLTLTLGCNEADFRASRHRVISSNTCDATAIAPVLGVLEKKIGIENVSMTILHPWLNQQNLLDAYTPANADKNFQLGRSAIDNIIPKTTSAENAVRAVLPALSESQISALSYRIPTSIVACADLSVHFSRATEKAELLSCLLEFQNKNTWKIIGINREPLVSSDFKGSDYSTVLEERLLSVKGRFAKLTLWYDNESGYAARVLDQVRYCTSGAE